VGHFFFTVKFRIPSPANAFQSVTYTDWGLRTNFKSIQSCKENKMNLTIAQAMNSASPSLYILNTSAMPGTPAGAINMAVTESNGKTANVQLPVTNIPFDLTIQATKNAILESPSFRRAHAKRLIAIMEPTDAEKTLATPEGVAEYNRVMNIVSGSEDLLPTASPEVQALVAQEANTVSGLAMMIATADNEDEALGQLALQSKALTVDDLRYVAAQSKSARVKQKVADIILSN
jgi:hypothetical protein